MTNTWSNERIIDFISVIHAHPELWNVDSKKFKDRNAKKDGWALVADKFGVSSDEAYKKFRSLRTYAKNEEKKRKIGSSSGKWFAYDAISFILTQDTSNADTGLDSETEKTTGNVTRNLDNEDSVDQEEVVDSETIDCLPSLMLHSEPCASKKTRTPDPSFEKTQNFTRQAGEKSRNEYAGFVEHIANKLSKYDDYTRAQAEFKIMQVLYECDMEMYRKSASNQPSTNYSPHARSKES